MLKLLCIFSISLCFFCYACSESEQELKTQLLNSSDVEELEKYANKIRELGSNGIPIFLEVISDSITEQDNLANYAKLTLTLQHLHNMAKEGISSNESIPVLLNVLENQRSIADSLITANTIKIITGVDVGYNQKFVETYTIADEPRRREMILKWKSLSSNK